MHNKIDIHASKLSSNNYSLKWLKNSYYVFLKSHKYLLKCLAMLDNGIHSYLHSTPLRDIFLTNHAFSIIYKFTYFGLELIKVS